MTPRSPFQRFMAELRRRHVPQTAAVYAVAAWAAIQFADVVVPNFGWPQWVVSAVIIASGIGFPVVLALSWFLEWGPEGIHRAEAAEPGSTAPATRGNAPWIAAVAVLAVGIGTAIVVAGLLRQPEGAGDGSAEAVAPERPATRFDRRRLGDSVVPMIPPIHEITAPGYSDSITRVITDSLFGELGPGGDLGSLVEMATRLGREAGGRAAGPVIITIPETWRFGAPHPVRAGDTLRIRGIARAEVGVAAVEVDGRVVADSDDAPAVLPFQAEWVAGRQVGFRRVVVGVRTADGGHIERPFAVTVVPSDSEDPEG